MSLNIELLRELCVTPGAPGYEQRIREVVLREIKPLVDTWETDPMGNVIALKRGKDSRKAMAAAHMDEISFIITHVDDRGFARFHRPTCDRTWKRGCHRRNGQQTYSHNDSGRAKKGTRDQGLLHRFWHVGRSGKKTGFSR